MKRFDLTVFIYLNYIISFHIYHEKLLHCPQHLQANLELESPYFLTTLVAIGHIAQLCPGKFAMPVRGIVSKFIVKELLMQDRVCVHSLGRARVSMDMCLFSGVTIFFRV